MKPPALLLSILLAALTGCGERDSNPEPRENGESGLELKAPFAYPAEAGEPVGVTYLDIVNHGPEDDRLVSASSEVADRIELHETSEVDGVMQMRHQKDGFPLPVGQTLRMEPGGYHLMLMEMTSGLSEGESYPLTLVFEKGGNRTIEVPIGNDIEQR